MARTDTLGNFLTDVAEAIRTKEGTTETITASEFDTRISNLSGSEDLTEELTVYGTELEEQNVTLDDIVEALQGKGSGSGSGSLEIYSTEEVLTNSTWIDGKPIYRIVAQITLPASITEGTYSSVSADLTSLNIDTPVNVSGLVKKSNGTEYWNINTYNNTLSANDSIWCCLGGSGTNVYVSTNASAYASASVNIIVEYTKTE